MIDKHPEPFNKVCGDGISGHAISALKRISEDLYSEILNSPATLHSHGVKFISPDLHELELSFTGKERTEPSGLLIRRIDLMNILMEQINKDPLIEYMPGTKIISAEFTPEKVMLQAEQGKEMTTPLLMIATGTGSLLARKVQEDSIIEYPGVGVRTYFSNVKGIADHFPIEMHFYKELLPWYLWIFPLPGGICNVGLALLHKDVRSHPESMKELLFKILKEKSTLRERFRHAKQEGKVEAGRLSYFTHWKKLAGMRYMVIGDAAGLVDPFTGEGIGNAMMSGVIASNHVKERFENNDFSEKSLAAYEQEVRRRMGPELEMGQRIQKLAKNASLLNLVISRAAKNPFIRKRLQEMIFDINRKGKLTTPLFYLKVLLNIGR